MNLMQRIFTKFLVFLFFVSVVGGCVYMVDKSGMIPGREDFSLNIDTNVKNVSDNFIDRVFDTSPKLSFVSATEYTSGDGYGSTIIKLIDWRGNFINTTCYEEILYPNKSIYISWTLMTPHTEYSNYYMDFDVPEPLGIYDQEVRCEVSNRNISLGKGFHVGNISNIVKSEIDSLKRDIMVSVT